MNPSRTRPGGWSLGPPRAPGRYWYAESREVPAALVTVDWSAVDRLDGSLPQLVFHPKGGSPARATQQCTGWWRADTDAARLHDGG